MRLRKSGTGYERPNCLHKFMPTFPGARRHRRELWCPSRERDGGGAVTSGPWDHLTCPQSGANPEWATTFASTPSRGAWPRHRIGGRSRRMGRCRGLVSDRAGSYSNVPTSDCKRPGSCACAAPNRGATPLKCAARLTQIVSKPRIHQGIKRKCRGALCRGWPPRR